MTIPGRHFARNLIYRRTLLFQMVRRDFEQRFIGSTVGWLWALILPLVQLVSWVFVFQVCMHQQVSPGEVTTNYPLLLFCGYLPWLLFSETVTRSASSLVDHANLITKTVFPAEVVSVSIFLSSLIHHAIALVLALGAVAVMERRLSPMVVFLPVYMLLVGIVAWTFAALESSLRIPGFGR